jgi:hypothetical protein
LLTFYPYPESHPAGGAFRPKVDTILPGCTDIAVIIQYGFSADKSDACIPWDKLLYIQAGSAAFLYEIVGADCAIIFRLVGCRGPDEAVRMASC